MAKAFSVIRILIPLFAHLAVLFVDGDAAVLIFRQLFGVGDGLGLRVEQFDRLHALGELHLPLAVFFAQRNVIVARGRALVAFLCTEGRLVCLCRVLGGSCHGWRILFFHTQLPPFTHLL